jgi:hypothetical protein
MNKNDGRPSQSPLACNMTAIPLTERETHLNTSRILFSDIKKFESFLMVMSFGWKTMRESC